MATSHVPYIEYAPLSASMQAVRGFRVALKAGGTITMAIIGDSTTCGYGANPAATTWTNGLAYGYLNAGWGPNWTNVGNTYIQTDGNGFINQSGSNYYNIPSSVVLLESWMKTYNSNNLVHNFGGSGWDANNHVIYNSVAALNGNSRKPTVVFIATGINSAKNSLDQTDAVQTLINQCIAANMAPVLVLEHNVGNWDTTNPPSSWTTMNYWWSVTRPKLKTLALVNRIDIIDLGTDTQQIDITKLYDPFHPNAAGYVEISNIYKDWCKLR